MLSWFSRRGMPDSLWPHGLHRTPGSSILPYLLEFAQIQVPWVGDALSPSHPLPPLSPSPDYYTIFHLFSHSAGNDWVSDPVREGRRQRQTPTSFALLYLEAKETEISLELKQSVVSIPKESGKISPFSVQRDSGWLTTRVCLGLSQFGGKIPWKPTQSWANWKLISHLGRSGPCWEGMMSRQLCGVDWMDLGLRCKLERLPYGWWWTECPSPRERGWDLCHQSELSSTLLARLLTLNLLTDTNIFSFTSFLVLVYLIHVGLNLSLLSSSCFKPEFCKEPIIGFGGFFIQLSLTQRNNPFILIVIIYSQFCFCHLFKCFFLCFLIACFLVCFVRIGCFSVFSFMMLDFIVICRANRLLILLIATS